MCRTGARMSRVFSGSSDRAENAHTRAVASEVLSERSPGQRCSAQPHGMGYCVVFARREPATESWLQDQLIVT